MHLELSNILCKELYGHYFRIWGLLGLSQMFKSAIVVWKEPYKISKCMSVTTVQYSFIYTGDYELHLANILR